MKKYKILMVCILTLSTLCACSNKSAYDDSEKTKLENYGVLDEATSKSCKNTDTVKMMLDGTFDPSYVSNYCGIIIEDKDVNAKAINALLKGGYNEEEVNEFLSQPNFHKEKAKRYARYKRKDSIEDIILDVNLDLDLEPYEQTKVIKDLDDVTMLVNKFNALPENYEPELVEMKSNICRQDVDFSCQTVDIMYLRKEAYDAYIEFCKAAKEEGLEIRAIAAYRTYEYQYGLWSYNAEAYGLEYADAYYARPGQSEHNTGLAVDITFNDYNYNEIENYEGYDWILDNMHNYGFILRYPEDKVDYTRYGYESWHMRFVGKEVATECYENNWCLEEYYAHH